MTSHRNTIGVEGTLSPLRAVAWRPLLFILPVVACLAFGATLALTTPENFDARTELSVGRIDLATPGALSGFSSATQALAAGYSRAIDADAVVDPVARRLRLARGTVRSRLAATPVPESPVIRVQARAPTGRQAVRTANAGAQALVAYVDRLNGSRSRSQRLFRAFREAALDYTELSAERQRVRRAIGDDPTPAEEQQLARLEADAEVALLRRESLRIDYQNSTVGNADTGTLEVLDRARAATSDRGRRLQINLFIGLVVGIALGLALVTTSAKRRAKLHHAGG